MRIPGSSLGFLVNAGYKVAKISKKKAKGDERTSKRREEDEEKMWKKVWKLDIKKKIQHFI